MHVINFLFIHFCKCPCYW